MDPEHVLKGMIRDGNTFPAAVPELVTRLAGKLDLAPEDVAFEFNSLARVDEAVRRLYPPVRRSKPDLLLPLVAYVSEIGRRELRGRWDMRQADDGETWEPWVIGSDGREEEFFTLVFSEFCDVPDESASVVYALLGRIRAGALFPMVDKAAADPRAIIEALHEPGHGDQRDERARNEWGDERGERGHS
jgi:hypothetical protein